MMVGDNSSSLLEILFGVLQGSNLGPLLFDFFICLFFYNIVNHKQILTKYYNHQEHTYCYLGGYKNTMLEQKLLKQITKIKILKEERKVKKK